MAATPSRGNGNCNEISALRTFEQPVFPLPGWLFRVRPDASGRFAIGCGWLIWVRLEGHPLHNPPRIALDAGFVGSGIGLLTPDLIKSQDKSCRGRPLYLPSGLGFKLVYEKST